MEISVSFSLRDDFVEIVQKCSGLSMDALVESLVTAQAARWARKPVRPVGRPVVAPEVKIERLVAQLEELYKGFEDEVFRKHQDRSLLHFRLQEQWHHFRMLAREKRLLALQQFFAKKPWRRYA